jgi:hypothetical protein
LRNYWWYDLETGTISATSPYCSIDDVQDDMIKKGVKRWRTKAMDRGEWRKICEAAKVLQEL